MHVSLEYGGGFSKFCTSTAIFLSCNVTNHQVSGGGGGGGGKGLKDLPNSTIPGPLA